MAKKVKWTTEAENTFEKVIAYIEKNWSELEAKHFTNLTDKTISYISEYPLMFRKSAKANIREAVITKHNLLIYRVKTSHIELLSFWDTRKNPKKKLKRKK